MHETKNNTALSKQTVEYINKRREQIGVDRVDEEKK
jgi:hypothetical protein